MSEVQKFEICQGRDDGNNAIKIYTEYKGKAQKWMIPTVYSDYKESHDALTNSASKAYDALDITINKIENGKEKALGRKLIGPTAVRFGGKDKRNRVLGQEKLKDDNLLFIGIGSQAYTIYKLLSKEQDLKGKKVEITIPTGLNLPYNESIKKGYRANYSLKNEGYYQVVFNNRFFADSEGQPLVMNLNIENTITGTEGVQALKSYVYKKDGKTLKIKAENLLEKIIIVIEGGAFSSEIIAIQFIEETDEDEYDMYSKTDEIKIKPIYYKSLCKGIEQGVGTAIIDTITDLETRYPGKVDNLERVDIERAIYKNKGLLPSGINVMPYYDDNMKKLAQNIVEKIVSNISSNDVKNKVYKILLAGGIVEAKCGKENIEALLKQNGYEKTFMGEDIIKAIEDPVHANAKGAFDQINKKIPNNNSK